MAVEAPVRPVKQAIDWQAADSIGVDMQQATRLAAKKVTTVVPTRAPMLVVQTCLSSIAMVALLCASATG